MPAFLIFRQRGTLPASRSLVGWFVWIQQEREIRVRLPRCLEDLRDLEPYELYSESGLGYYFLFPAHRV